MLAVWAMGDRMRVVKEVVICSFSIVSTREPRDDGTTALGSGDAVQI